MAIEVETKDCTSLGDAELEEMADLCGEGPNPFEIGVLSKQTEEWVLCTTAREVGKLKGFSFCTLERIGGTPSVILGLGSVKRCNKRDAVLRAIMLDQSRRALLAFPDEDVLFGARFNEASGFEAFTALNNIIPRPDHRASGEERAWGRRLIKRYGIDATTYDDRSFIVTGDGAPTCLFDHETSKPERVVPGVAAFFDALDIVRGDVLIGFGWAFAEELEKLN